MAEGSICLTLPMTARVHDRKWQSSLVPEGLWYTREDGVSVEFGAGKSFNVYIVAP